MRCIALALGLATLTQFEVHAQSVALDECSPLKDRKVLLLPGNGHDDVRNVTLTTLRTIATRVGFTMTNGNPLALTDAVLNDYDIIVFNYFFETNKEAVFPKTSKDAFMRWLKKGKKGYLGYHTSGANEWAADEWRSYQDSVTGMRYALHGAGTPSGTVDLNKDPAIQAMPIVKGLPATFTANDEWYEYTTDSKIFKPEWNWKILYNLSKVAGPRSPEPPNHPAAWFREDEKATRFFYSIFFHTLDGANSDFFKSVLLRALEYVAGPTPATGYPASCGPVAVAPSPQEKFKEPISYMAGRQLKVDLADDYNISIWTQEGRRLGSLSGNGKRTYEMPAIRIPGLYIIKIESNSGIHVRKIMAY
jgi:hypothetical protein